MIIKIKNSYKVMKVTIVEIGANNKSFNHDVSYRLVKHMFNSTMTLEDFQKAIQRVSKALDKFNMYGKNYNATKFADIEDFIPFDVNKSYKLQYRQL